MTTVIHANLTGSELHEPKGVAAASSGQVYVANGSGSGSWMDQTTTTGAVKSVNLYNSTQTVTIPTGATKALIKMWGGSGGSGGSNGSSTFSVSAGGGAGGYVETYLTSLTAGNTVSFTRGAAGSAGTATGAGGDGGASTLVSGTQTISTLTANGGSKSVVGSSTTPTNGGAGGTASGGNLINLTGQNGGGSFTDGTNGFIGPGGVNFYTVAGAGVKGSGISSTAGNAGSAGGMIVIWYT